jgi:hypothetical protein
MFLVVSNSENFSLLFWHLSARKLTFESLLGYGNILFTIEIHPSGNLGGS